MTVFFLCATILFLAGISLVVRGWRGRVIDDHPICRKCGFDLFGKPPDSTRCAECGTDVTVADSTRVGHRELRRGSLCGGAALLLPSLLLLAVSMWISARGLSLDRHKPAWWLLNEVDNPSARGTAIAELDRRYSLAQLPDARLTTLVEKIIAVQGDLTQEWLPQWGSLIESAQLAGKVSASQWERYARQAFCQPTLKVRPFIGRGDPLVWAIRFASSRAASGTRLRGHCVIRRIEVSPGVTLMLNWNFEWPWALLDSAVATPIDEANRRRMADGLQLIHAEGEVTVYDRSANSASRPFSKYTWQTETSCIVLPAGQASVKLIHDDRYSAAVTTAIQPELYRSGLDERQVHVRKGQVDLSMLIGGPPVPLAYEFFLRSESKEWYIGSAVVRPQRSHVSRWIKKVSELPGFDAERVDLIFRPSPEVAAKTLDLSEIWGEEIIVPDLPVNWE